MNPADDSSEKRDVPVTRLRRALILFFVVIVVYYLAPRKQSFLISADTEILSVITDGSATAAWHIDHLTLCTRRDKPEIPAFGSLKDTVSKEQSGVCDSRFFNEHTVDDADVVWPKDIELSVRMGDGESIEVHARNPGSPGSMLMLVDEKEVTDNSILKFDKSTLNKKSILILSGKVAIGEKIRPESRHLLRRGRYEIREHLPFRERSSLVHTGNLVVGDWIQVVSNRGHVPLSGRAFVTSAKKNARGFSVVLNTPAARSGLQIARAGQVTVFSASWTERLTSDLLPVALSTLLGLFGACLAILHSFKRKDSV